MSFKKVEICDLLLKEDPRGIEEQLIDYVIYNREELKLHPIPLIQKLHPSESSMSVMTLNLDGRKLKVM